MVKLVKEDERDLPGSPGLRPRLPMQGNAGFDPQSGG